MVKLPLSEDICAGCASSRRVELAGMSSFMWGRGQRRDSNTVVLSLSMWSGSKSSRFENSNFAAAV